MLRLWTAGGHPWENSQEETRQRSGRRKAGLGLFYSSGPIWAQPLPAGIGPAESKEKLEIPARLGANRPRRAGSPPGPQTPPRARVESVGKSSGPARWMARPPGQCTASRPGADPFSVPGHGELAGPGFPPGPAQGASPLCNWFPESRAP